jgi:hypothetical protein
MDPAGLVLENYDVIGGWRETYRTLGDGQPLKTEIEGKRVVYKLGPKVDAGTFWPDGRKVNHIDELKQVLLANKDQVASCLAERLLVYSTGGGLEFSDRALLGDIVAKVRTQNYGFRSLVHEVVQSRTFLTK